jgi:hypothetical protein
VAFDQVDSSFSPLDTDTPILVVDDQSLKDVIPHDTLVTLLEVRRVRGVPYYRYLSNGNHNTPFQPWSSSKIFAASNAADHMRGEL